MTRKKTKFEDYQGESATFQHEIYTSLRRSKRLAWIFCGVMGGIALLSVLALVIALPLKQTEVVVISHDKNTGHMELASGLDHRGKQLTQEEKVIKFELMRYMNAREGYFYPVQQKKYNLVMALSDGKAAKEYAAIWDINNDENPSVIYSDKATIDVRFKSIVVEDNIAQIRFERRLSFNKQLTVSHWIAIIKFDHNLNRAQNLKQIAVNPLAFTVTNYRLEEENLE
jgi:type IV secretion system protein VirB8